jgi:hypothetical protein
MRRLGIGPRRVAGSRTGLTEHQAVEVLRVVAAIGALFFVAYTEVDPDLWGHVRFGLDILEDGRIASVDPYSFTSDRPWVNHEWLAEALMGLAHRSFGPAGLVALKACVVVAMVLVAAKAIRRVAWRPIDHDLLIALLLVATFTRAHLLRPQVFSLLMFAVMLFILIGADRGQRRLLVALPLVLAAWANLHGGWLVGLGVASIWIVVRFVQGGAGTVGRAWLALLWAACVAATLVNPYGVGLWRFLRETVGLSRPEIQDWLPLLQLPVVIVAMTATVAATALAAVVKARRSADPAYVLIVSVLGVLTLRVGRIDAFFAVAVVMLLGPYLGRSRAASWEPPQPDGPPLWRRPLPIAAVLAVALTLASTAGRTIACIPVSDAPEPEATAFLERQAGGADVLTFFDWGQYAIWHLSPEIRVSLDGRRETVYSDALIQAHARLYNGEPGSAMLPDRLGADLVWLPVDFPAVQRLERAGWKRAFHGPVSVVLEREPERPVVRVATPDKQARCFPDA